MKTGGRGKAGGVKVAKNADEAVEAAAKILGMDIKGHTVKTVMIAQGDVYKRQGLGSASRSALTQVELPPV